MNWHMRRPRSAARTRIIAVAALVVIAGGVACSALRAELSPAAPAPSVAGKAATIGAPANTGAAPPAGVPASANPATAPGAAVPSSANPGSASAAAVPAPANVGAAQAAAAARAAGAPADATTSAAQPAESTASAADSSAQILDRMVIRTAQLSLEVQDMESALAQARAIAARNGGFVSASDTHTERQNDQDRTVANLTLQVRSDAADSAMSDLRALGKVTAETSGSQDVTDEYVDLDSNLRNLQATEAAILKLMDRATQIQDVLSLQRELTNVRGQIERIQGRKTYLERRTDMATISLALRLPAPASSPQPVSGAWDPIATALRGWQASLAVLRAAADVLIVVLAFSWWLLPFAALAGYVLLHRRRPITPTPAPITPEGA
jgi:uncharacterized protein DUF4349